MIMKFKHLSVGLASLALVSCGAKTVPLQSTPTLSVVSQAELPGPSVADQSAAGRPYVVGPLDELTIEVFGVKELTAREVQVDSGGNISFPLAGSLVAAGKTPREIEQEIAGRLRANFIRDPQVSVNLTKTVSQVVTVDGQVTQPGLYPVIGRMTLMQTVASARGATEFAKLEDVVVFRQAQGQRYAALYNLGAIRRGVYDDPQIYAGDVVVVGESRARRMFRDILAAAPLLTAPIIAVLQNSNNN